MLFCVEASSEICKASEERVRTCKDYIIGREITTLLKMTLDNVILLGHPTTVFSQMPLNFVLGYLE